MNTDEHGCRTVGLNWALALILLCLAVSSLTLGPSGDRAMIGGVVLSGHRLELLQFLRQPHEYPVVVATGSFRELAPVLAGGEAKVVDIPPVSASPVQWQQALLAQRVTHVALWRDVPMSSLREDRERAAARAIAELPNEFNLIWDGRTIEVYEIAR